MSIHNKERILKLVKERKVLTTSEIAKELGVSWNTAEKMFLELAIEGKVQRVKKEGVNLWLVGLER